MMLIFSNLNSFFFLKKLFKLLIPGKLKISCYIIFIPISSAITHEYPAALLDLLETVSISLNDLMLINYKPNVHHSFLIALVRVLLETYIFLTIYQNVDQILMLQKMITLISAYQ